MQNEKVRSVWRKKKQDKTAIKNQPVQEVQKDQGNSTSANAKAESAEQSHAADRVHSLQQDKPDHNHAGDKMQYEKLKCVYCGYEVASRARKPKCYKCGRRRLNRISEFSVTKPNKVKGGVNMAKESEAEKAEEKKKVPQDEEADEIDAMFD